MAVFRVERTGDFTVMSNHHLRNAELSLKAKGLLSLMLSLPESWNYSIRGLSAICREGVDAITSALRELEEAGYVVRRRLRDAGGRICDTEYVIYEQPRPAMPEAEVPDPENPDAEGPDAESPPQLKKEPSKKERANTDLSITDSFPSGPEQGREEDGPQIQTARAWILENVDYEGLCRKYPHRQEELDELVELMVETVCARRRTARIAGGEFPQEVVRGRFLKLNSIHLEFVMDCLEKNTSAVRNIKQYLLAVLFNAPATMEHYYAAQAGHDLYGS